MCLITQGKCGNEYLFQCSGSFKEIQLQVFVYFKFTSFVGPQA